MDKFFAQIFTSENMFAYLAIGLLITVVAHRIEKDKHKVGEWGTIAVFWLPILIIFLVVGICKAIEAFFQYEI